MFPFFWGGDATSTFSYLADQAGAEPTITLMLGQIGLLMETQTCKQEYGSAVWLQVP